MRAFFEEGRWGSEMYNGSTLLSLDEVTVHLGGMQRTGDQ